MKKFLSILLCAAILMVSIPVDTSYAASTWPSGVSIEAEGGILVDANSGTVLYGKNIHETYYPASITKILTALVILKHCDLDETVTFTHSAVNTLEPGSSILGARVNDKLSVRDCLYALLLQSANEVANALAEHCSGSIEDFAVLISDFDVDINCINSFNILYVSCFCIYIDIVYSISFGIESITDKNVLNLGNSYSIILAINLPSISTHLKSVLLIYDG